MVRFMNCDTIHERCVITCYVDTPIPNNRQSVYIFDFQISNLLKFDQNVHPPLARSILRLYIRKDIVGLLVIQSLTFNGWFMNKRGNTTLYLEDKK